MKATVKTIASQPSWVIRCDQVELAVTQLGGHMAPVTFYRRSGAGIQPYYISPWQDEGLKITDPVLVPVRGDFFCMPFGGGELNGRKHPGHGESAVRKWKFSNLATEAGKTILSLSLQTAISPGTITKRLGLVDGQNVVYCQHVLEGFDDTMPMGHHAILAVPQEPGALKVATSPVRFRMTNPTPCGNPAEKEYGSVLPNRKFKDLSRVPLIWREEPVGDCSAFPVRQGFVDLLASFNKPRPSPAWTTAAVDQAGYMWFSLKDPAVLPTAMMWIENHGRHQSPWSGRNTCLGLEDVCGYFAMGLAPSVKPNPISRAGIPTAIRLRPDKPTVINYIQGVVKIPKGFVRARSASFEKGKVVFTSVTGKKGAAEVNYDFLQSGQM